jgi:hypothetical protein
MAAKTFYLKDTAVSGHGSLSESDPGASTTGTGWVVAKVASGNFSKMVFATERLSSTFGGTSTLATPAAPASADSWRSENTINGTFANANWVLTFPVRAVSSSSNQRGRVKVRLWRSTNADGSGATELTAATQTGTTLGGISTSADNTSVVTWAPGATKTLTDEYLFIQCEWEITTASGNVNGDIDFRAGTAATMVTANFTPASATLTPSLFDDSADTFHTPKIIRTANPPLYDDTADTFYTPVVEIESDAWQILPPLYNNQPGAYSPTGFNPAAYYVEADAFYSATISQGAAGTTLSPSLYADDDTFYTHAVAPGAVTLAPSLYADADTFYDPNAVRVVSPALYSDADTFYAPTATAGAVTLSPSLYDDGDAFHSATVSRGAITLEPSLYADADVFYSPNVVRHLSPALYADDDTFYSANASRILSPALFADGDTFYTPVVTAGAVTLTPSLYTDGDTFYTAVVAQGARTLSPSLYADDDTFYSGTVLRGAVALSPSLYADADTFYAPTVIGAGGLAPDLYTDGDTFYTHAVAAGTVTLFPDLYADGDTFYDHDVISDQSVGSHFLPAAIKRVRQTMVWRRAA